MNHGRRSVYSLSFLRASFVIRKLIQDLLKHPRRAKEQGLRTDPVDLRRIFQAEGSEAIRMAGLFLKFSQD